MYYTCSSQQSVFFNTISYNDNGLLIAIANSSDIDKVLLARTSLGFGLLLVIAWSGCSLSIQFKWNVIAMYN